MYKKECRIFSIYIKKVVLVSGGSVTLTSSSSELGLLAVFAPVATPVLVSPSWSLVGRLRSSFKFSSSGLAARECKLEADSTSLFPFLTVDIHSSFSCLISYHLLRKSLVLRKRSCVSSLLGCNSTYGWRLENSGELRTLQRPFWCPQWTTSLLVPTPVNMDTEIKSKAFHHKHQTEQLYIT